jgi:hypothetical protein
MRIASRIAKRTLDQPELLFASALVFLAALGSKSSRVKRTGKFVASIDPLEVGFDLPRAIRICRG